MELKAVYEVEGDVNEIGKAIAYGQTIGNPDWRTPHDEGLNRYLAKYETHGNHVIVKFPVKNFGRHDGVSYLLSVLMGGQCDMNRVQGCRLVELDLSAIRNRFPLPRYGVKGMRELSGVYGRPLLGAVVKPKIGLPPEQYAKVVRELVEGGIDFIKEDEILTNQGWCPMEPRLRLIRPLLSDYPVIYTTCVTADGVKAIRRAKAAKIAGAKAVHLNIWSGLGTFLTVREYVDIPLFFQKSGDKVWTTGPFSIDSSVLCQLVNLIGCDMAHVGMYGGSMSEGVMDLRRRIKMLDTTLPSFSCGLTPKQVPQIIEHFGIDVILTSGGWIAGHKDGIKAAIAKMREAINAKV